MPITSLLFLCMLTTSSSLEIILRKSQTSPHCCIKTSRSKIWVISPFPGSGSGPQQRWNPPLTTEIHPGSSTWHKVAWVRPYSNTYGPLFTSIQYSRCSTSCWRVLFIPHINRTTYILDRHKTKHNTQCEQAQSVCLSTHNCSSTNCLSYPSASKECTWQWHLSISSKHPSTQGI